MVVRLILSALAIAVSETDCRAASAASRAKRYRTCAADGLKTGDGCFGSFPVSLVDVVCSRCLSDMVMVFVQRVVTRSQGQAVRPPRALRSTCLQKPRLLTI